MNLARRIKHAREGKAWTRSELARRIGVSTSAAVQWEQAISTAPSVENLIRIALLTDVSFEWLATGRGQVRGLEPNEIPALETRYFAQTMAEENMLDLLRRLSPDAQTMLIEFLSTIAPPIMRSRP